MAVLSGSCFAHDLATFDRLLLACRHTAMTVRLKVLDCKGGIMMHVCIKCQHQRWTLLYQPNARMATTMNPTLVAFGTFEPTLQIQVVFRKIGRLATHKQPRLKTAHHLGTLLVHGGSACLPRLPQRDELPLTLFPCGLLARPQSTLHCLQGLDVLGNVLQGLAGDIQSAVNATDETFQPRLCTPPFCACRLRSSDARTSCNSHSAPLGWRSTYFSRGAFCAHTATPNRGMLASPKRRYTKHLHLRSVVWGSCS